MVRVNVSISENILKKVDNYKKYINLTRSGLIIRALENFFVEIENRILEERKKKAIKDIIGIREKIGKELAGWNSTAEIRKLRESRWGDPASR